MDTLMFGDVKGEKIKIAFFIRLHTGGAAVPGTEFP
jgi:hypothetical protein